MKENKYFKAIAFFIVVTLTSTSLFFVQPKTTKAFIDIPWPLILEGIRGVAYGILSSLNDRYTQKYVDKALDKYKIRNVLEYTASVADEVYVSAQFANRTKEDVVALKSRIDQIKRKAATDQNGQPVDTSRITEKQARDALDADSIDPTKLTAADFDIAIQAATNVLSTTSYGRELVYTAQAQEIISTAYEAARLTQEGSGVKGQYTCQKTNPEPYRYELVGTYSLNVSHGQKVSKGQILFTSSTVGDIKSDVAGTVKIESRENNYVVVVPDSNALDVTQRQAQYVSCITRNAPEYVHGQISSKIDALFNSQSTPPTNVLLIGKFFGATIAKKLGDKILKE